MNFWSVESKTRVSKRVRLLDMPISYRTYKTVCLHWFELERTFIRCYCNQFSSHVRQVLQTYRNVTIESWNTIVLRLFLFIYDIVAYGRYSIALISKRDWMLFCIRVFLLVFFLFCCSLSFSLVTLELRDKSAESLLMILLVFLIYQLLDLIPYINHLNQIIHSLFAGDYINLFIRFCIYVFPIKPALWNAFEISFVES